MRLNFVKTVNDPKIVQFARHYCNPLECGDGIAFQTHADNYRFSRRTVQGQLEFVALQALAFQR